MPMKLDVQPLTPALWPAFEDLFGPQGAVHGCWCMYWRIGGQYRERPRDENRRALKRIVDEGRPPGLLALDGDIAVGWTQLTPRSDMPHFERKRATKMVDDIPVWSLSCFYIRKGYRRQGVKTALIVAALKAAKRAGAPALEAYPLDASSSPGAAFTGYISTFARLGFKIVARPHPSRAIMRHDLKGIGR